jgi:hypothetical protein
MTQRFIRRCVIAALIVSGVTTGLGTGGAALPSVRIELEATDNVTGAISVDDTGSRASIEARGGNPLRAIPLTDLSATRERPIFSPSRRPPAAAVAATPYVPLGPAKMVAPNRPQLSLVGTVAGEKDGFGIFLDRTANVMLRLKTGQEHNGWLLREIRSREALFEKGQKTVTLALPVRSVEVPADQGVSAEGISGAR